MTKRNHSKPPVAERIRRSSGNVFADIGFHPAEAGELQVKAQLTRLISNRIRAMGLTQIKAARRLGIAQPDVSRLMNARFTGFSTARLIALLNALELDVDITVHPKKGNQRHEPGTVRVRESAAA